MYSVFTKYVTAGRKKRDVIFRDKGSNGEDVETGTISSRKKGTKSSGCFSKSKMQRVTVNSNYFSMNYGFQKFLLHSVNVARFEKRITRTNPRFLLLQD